VSETTSIIILSLGCASWAFLWAFAQWGWKNSIQHNKECIKGWGETLETNKKLIQIGKNLHAQNIRLIAMLNRETPTVAEDRFKIDFTNN